MVGFNFTERSIIMYSNVSLRNVVYPNVSLSGSETDYCSPNPCQNGGRCYWTRLGPICTCAKGFIGSTCADGEY